jgi:hypothetical protein
MAYSGVKGRHTTFPEPVGRGQARIGQPCFVQAFFSTFLYLRLPRLLAEINIGTVIPKENHAWKQRSTLSRQHPAPQERLRSVRILVPEMTQRDLKRRLV